MRLGQLSRKLNVSATEIGSLLDEEFKITIGDHPNIKIDDEHAKFILEKFQKNVTESLIPNSEIEGLSMEETTPVENTQSGKTNEKGNEILPDPIFEEQEKIETIRVKATKLEGLTVVDKIELPEPPPPEMVEIDGVMYDKAELKKQRIAERKEREVQKKKEAVRRSAERKLKANRPSDKSKNEISFAEKRRLEEKQDRERMKQEEDYKRSRQKKHYQSKHKIYKTATIKPKQKEEVEIDTEESFVETRPEPKTWVGKFWRWLNTY